VHAADYRTEACVQAALAAEIRASGRLRSLTCREYIHSGLHRRLGGEKSARRRSRGCLQWRWLHRKLQRLVHELELEDVGMGLRDLDHRDQRRKAVLGSGDPGQLLEIEFGPPTQADRAT